MLSICIWWFLRYHLIFRRTIDTVIFSAQGKFLRRLWCLRNDSLLWDLSTPSVVSAMGHESCWHPNYTCWPYVSDKRNIQPFLFLGYVHIFSPPDLTPAFGHRSCCLRGTRETSELWHVRQLSRWNPHEPTCLNKYLESKADSKFSDEIHL